MSQILHFNIHVYGRVQGVFYRVTSQRKAHELGIQGFVRNEPDGSVYIEAEGAEENVYKFIKWCNQGPSGADVEKVDVQEGTLKNFTDFKIER